jgi:hypothetical protein
MELSEKEGGEARRVCGFIAALGDEFGIQHGPGIQGVRISSGRSVGYGACILACYCIR